MKSILFLLISLLWTCSEAPNLKRNMAEKPLSFLALGDSYTIGESVSISDRWPIQLVTRLRDMGIEILDPQIIATTGWTTDELQAAVQKEQPAADFDLVSLLIGVNNQYRGYSMSQYEMEFEVLLDQAIGFANGKSENVFVISIPDYGVTDFAKNRSMDSERIGRELDKYNEMAQRITNSKEVQFFDITEWSRNAAKDTSLITTDELHPSGKMYQNWVDTCFEWVLTNFQGR